MYANGDRNKNHAQGEIQDSGSFTILTWRGIDNNNNNLRVQ